MSEDLNTKKDSNILYYIIIFLIDLIPFVASGFFAYTEHDYMAGWCLVAAILMCRYPTVKNKPTNVSLRIKADSADELKDLDVDDLAKKIKDAIEKES